uniref:LigA n=1 Tax=Parastrongyloides trichosuri TaxID=131310 RepID=A0A0N4ZXP0_PARTI
MATEKSRARRRQMVSGREPQLWHRSGRPDRERPATGGLYGADRQWPEGGDAAPDQVDRRGRAGRQRLRRPALYARDDSGASRRHGGGDRRWGHGLPQQSAGLGHGQDGGQDRHGPGAKLWLRVAQGGGPSVGSEGPQPFRRLCADRQPALRRLGYRPAWRPGRGHGRGAARARSDEGGPAQGLRDPRPHRIGRFRGSGGRGRARGRGARRAGRRRRRRRRRAAAVDGARTMTASALTPGLAHHRPAVHSGRNRHGDALFDRGRPLAAVGGQASDPFRGLVGGHDRPGHGPPEVVVPRGLSAVRRAAGAGADDRVHAAGLYGGRGQELAEPGLHPHPAGRVRQDRPRAGSGALVPRPFGAGRALVMEAAVPGGDDRRALPAGGQAAGPGFGHDHRPDRGRRHVHGGPELARHRRRRRRRRGRHPALRHVRHARLSAQPRADLPRPGSRPVGHRLQHHPVQDRPGLGRPDGQGLWPGQSEPAGVPAGTPYRLHLLDRVRGVRLPGLLHRPGLLCRADPDLAADRGAVAQPFRSSERGGHDGLRGPVHAHQRGDGDGAGAGRRRAHAAAVLWRVVHDDGDDRLRPDPVDAGASLCRTAEGPGAVLNGCTGVRLPS